MHQMQTEVTAILGGMVSLCILCKVQDSQYFSIIMVEAKAVSRAEMIAIISKYYS